MCICSGSRRQLSSTLFRVFKLSGIQPFTRFGLVFSRHDFMQALKHIQYSGLQNYSRAPSLQNKVALNAVENGHVSIESLNPQPRQSQSCTSSPGALPRGTSLADSVSVPRSSTYSAGASPYKNCQESSILGYTSATCHPKSKSLQTRINPSPHHLNHRTNPNRNLGRR